MTYEEALTQALRAAELDDSARGFVSALAESADEGWRACCGSGCKPCSTQLAVAVDRLRELLRAGGAP